MLPGWYEWSIAETEHIAKLSKYCLTCTDSVYDCISSTQYYYHHSNFLHSSHSPPRTYILTMLTRAGGVWCMHEYPPQ